jgi:hypothetical protein
LREPGPGLPASAVASGRERAPPIERADDRMGLRTLIVPRLRFGERMDHGERMPGFKLKRWDLVIEGTCSAVCLEPTQRSLIEFHVVVDVDGRGQFDVELRRVVEVCDSVS